MLAYVTAEGQGTADRLLSEAARALLRRGVPVAGVIQENLDSDTGGPCDMVLQVLATGRMIPISQKLGPLSKGCRLDPAGLEQAAGMVERALDGVDGPLPRLLIVNKFGKQEIDGRGFRPLIGCALAQGIPVLTAVNAANLDAFREFADGIGEAVGPSLEEILNWVERASSMPA